ncbi:MAG: hypothetical protein OXT67_10895 [Zetaproteobacteria bacterium]|nr:hypothetical protein [Zetaproteobacteria bacterium]
MSQTLYRTHAPNRIVKELAPIFAFFLGCWGTKAWGFIHPHATPHAPQVTGEIVIRPTTEKMPSSMHGFVSTPQIPGAITLRRDQVSGTITFVAGNLGAVHFAQTMNTQEKQEQILQFTKKFIDTYYKQLQINWNDLNLNRDATLMGTEEQFVRFDVHRDGLKIKDAEVIFRFKRGKLLQVLNRSFPHATIISNNFAGAGHIPQEQNILSKFDVKKISQIASEFRAAPNAQSSQYELVLVDRYHIESKNGEKHSVEYVHGSTTIWELKNLHYHLAAQVTAPVFPRYYGDAPKREPLHFVSIQSESGNLTSDKKGMIPEAGEEAPTLLGLKGPRVRVFSASTTALSQQAVLENGRWSIDVDFKPQQQPWKDPTLAQVMAFQHTNKIIMTAKKYVQTPWFDRPLETNVNHPRTCNAYWDGSSINFFRGDDYCSNTALIADVIYHEWGHGLDDNTGGIYDSAYSEGFGDIMALIMERSPILGKGFFIRTGAGVRDLSQNKVYPRDRGEAHDEGLIIASTFWDMYTELKELTNADQAIDTLANFAFKMIFTTSRYTDVYEALMVIDDDDADISTPGPNFCTLNRNFTRHGLTTKDPTCG